MSRRPRERTQVEAVIQRFLDLSTRQQIEAFKAMREYLGAELVPETEAEREIVARGEALEAIATVSEHLGLPADKAPTTAQFREAAPNAAPGWNVTRVARSFGRWRLAQRAYLGERVTETEATREARRRSGGRRRSHEEHITGLREWLATNPDPTDSTAYDTWVETENERREAEGDLLLTSRASLGGILGLPWSTLLRVGKGEMTLAEAREARARELGQERLVGMRYVSLRLECSTGQATQTSNRPDFPVPVVEIAGTRAWEREDIDAYADGNPFPKRQQHELQDQIFQTRDLAAELDLDEDHLRTLMHKKRWNRIPEPSGKIGKFRFWWRGDVDGWKRERGSS